MALNAHGVMIGRITLYVMTMKIAIQVLTLKK
jgi:hypothetical protein